MSSKSTPRQSTVTQSGRTASDEGRRNTGNTDRGRGMATDESKAGTRKKAPSPLARRKPGQQGG